MDPKTVWGWDLSWDLPIYWEDLDPELKKIYKNENI